MKSISVWLATILICISGAALVAQDQPPAAAGNDQAAAGNDQAAAGNDSQTVAATADDADSPPAADAAADTAADEAQPPASETTETEFDDWEMPALPADFDDDIFIPSEEVAADEEVVFPVDI